MCLPIEHHVENLLAKGVHLGFEWEVVHNGSGFRCGYLNIPKGHPWFGKEYMDIDCDVHGGLTFSDFGTACPTHGSKDEWWIGFDCAQAGDSPDVFLPHESGAFAFGISWPGIVRTARCVRNECMGLAVQAAAIQNVMLTTSEV